MEAKVEGEDMVEFNDILSWIVPTVLGTLLAVFAYINKEGFRRGSARGQSEVTTTVLGNTIKELENTKKSMEKLNDTIAEQNINIIKLQERLRYLSVQMNELKERLGLPKIRVEDENSDTIDRKWK